MMFFSSGWASAGVIDPDLATAMRAAPPEKELSVIITLSGTTAVSLADAPSRHLRRAQVPSLLRARGATERQALETLARSRQARRAIPLWIINGMAVTARPAVIDELARQPGVDQVRLEQTFSPPRLMAAKPVAPEWNIDLTQAPALWALGFKGAGVVVANMDTGVDVRHPDLQRRWRGGSNSWFDPNGQHATPTDLAVSSVEDASGHGTSTMSLMVGGNAGGSAIGMAPEAKWIAVKIFNDTGVAGESAIHQGFQWLLDPDGNPATDDAPDIVNNSWGESGLAGLCNQSFDSDIHALRMAGITLVFAAGNNGPAAEGFNTSLSPANNPESLSVGAIDSLMDIAFFSSRGPSPCDGAIYPKLVAPGMNIRAADRIQNISLPAPYKAVSGTSFSAPHVAGALALLLSAYPTTSVADLERVLLASAMDLGLPGDDNTYGHGALDVQKAYQILKAQKQSAAHSLWWEYY